MNPVAVGLLDLFARDDVFVEGIPERVDARLRALGARVHRLRSVRAMDADGRADGWHAQLRDWVAQGHFDLVVVSHAWDAQTVEVLRGALPQGGRLVRFASGARGALDDRFDHVAGEGGVEALVTGAPLPPDGDWQPTSAKEIRARLAVVSPAKSATPVVALQGRPSIAGPVSGCPFLLDAKANPLFAHLGMDPSRVQTRGCTFCLDNVGAYAVAPEAEVVERWLRQLREIRAARPDVVEVLLVDERPHPYLPALFRALAGEPSLHGLELLVKSRVDWLLEFADGAVTQAIEEARKSGSVLHVYLVGFESFDQFHLDLFNKGCTVADNVRAIEVLRHLKQTWPDAFEFERYRAHGIVMFTPWTTPAQVRDAARVMREVRFHELRADAVRTRLRLYPRVPLHALAEADGLLVDAFDASRADRASEQGYDASVPWRFKEPLTEVVFQLASWAAGRVVPTDADALEAAAHFALRWPGLAEVPTLASLPFHGGLGALLPRGRRDGPAALTGYDPELELILSGHRQGCLKETIETPFAADLVRAYQAMGFEAAEVARHALSFGRGEHSDGDAYAIIAVARDAAALEQVLEAQRRHRHGQGADHDAARTMGRLMGYPSCCVEAFLAQADRGDNLENERLPFRRAPGRVLAPELNRLGSVRLLSHHPCAQDCGPSIHLARQVLDRLAPADAAWLMAQLSRPVLLLDFNRAIGLDGTWDGELFRVTSATPLGETRHLGFSLEGLEAVALSARGVTLHKTGGVVEQVRADRPLLVEPGKETSPHALEAMGGVLEAPAPRTQAVVARPLPPLPSVIRPGIAVRGYRIETVTQSRGSHLIELAAPGHRFQISVRPFEASSKDVSRCGPWGLEIEAIEALPSGAREAASVFARALFVASRPG